MKPIPADQRIRRERILATTREQLARLGYDGLSMRDLATAAEVATTTLYNLYQSKDDLILAALQDLLDDLGSRLAERNLEGVEFFIGNAETIAEQIVATPRYAEAMAKMLFNADASDAIVQVLIQFNIEQHTATLNQLADAGELEAETDTAFLSRTITANGWATILVWMKGFVALHDFKREYVASQLTVLKSQVVPGSATAGKIQRYLLGSL